ncbi:DNA/RNA nuclease SfsA [Marininema halotolerans]|uniref:Sugar fermentation stimulation protein homolog n=1 Tax=Marininema halotolerans TaxID=1155944 RepID=A0A1I6PTX2_9BACL|nr:DNA/RNA nuclease SfsA [Marininema halotolerans]SFS43653.1 sugar fermentation stimulation protein A [Marininema halotolerans]
MAVLWSGETIIGIFKERPNRFQAIVEIEGVLETVHVPNTGRMSGLLAPGTEVLLVRSNNSKRKHRFSLTLIRKQGQWVCVYSALANRVFEDGVQLGKVRGIDGTLQREVKIGESRIDFTFEGEFSTFIEVKCVTYEEDGVAMFPDAPTLRGRKHIGELIRATEEGKRGMVVFIIFMKGVTYFTPLEAVDPLFAEALKKAKQAGIELRAYDCTVNQEGIELNQAIPIRL